MTNAVEGYHVVCAKIAEAVAEAQRAPSAVTLVAVSKTFGQEAIKPVIGAGQRVFGENRVQEANSKWPALKTQYPDIKLHLIGPLQSNKVHDAVKLFDVIETVDREKIAKALAAEMQKQARFLPCFVQVNTGLEPQKAGVVPEQTALFVDLCRKKYHLNIVGLMCIPPVGEKPDSHFIQLAKLGAECALTELSMGMSHDFTTAIACGATFVRVGTAIFGRR